jgi:hypothetical protein
MTKGVTHARDRAAGEPSSSRSIWSISSAASSIVSRAEPGRGRHQASSFIRDGRRLHPSKRDRPSTERAVPLLVMERLQPILPVGLDSDANLSGRTCRPMTLEFDIEQFGGVWAVRCIIHAASSTAKTRPRGVGKNGEGLYSRPLRQRSKDAVRVDFLQLLSTARCRPRGRLTTVWRVFSKPPSRGAWRWRLSRRAGGAALPQLRRRSPSSDLANDSVQARHRGVACPQLSFGRTITSSSARA